VIAMAVNKVIYGTTVLVDLTNDTVAAETLLLGNTAHGKDGSQIVGTMTGSQTGVLMKFTALDVVYVSGTSAKIDIHELTPIYSQLTEEQIIVEITHLGLYVSGILGGIVNTDISYSYNSGSGVITLTAASSVFSASYTTKATVYITEQSPERPTQPEDLGYNELTSSTFPSESATYNGSSETLFIKHSPTRNVYADQGKEYTLETPAASVRAADSNFQASFIRKGISILGLTGTYDAGTGGGLPPGIAGIAYGTHTLSSAVAGTSSFSVTHGLGETPDMFLFYTPNNIANTYTMLYAFRSTKFAWRGSSYLNLCGYHGNSTTSLTCTNVTTSYGISALTETTATVKTFSTSGSYYWRAGTYNWVAIKFE